MTFPQLGLFCLVAVVGFYFSFPYVKRFATWVSMQNSWVVAGVVTAMIALIVAVYIFGPVLMFLIAR